MADRENLPTKAVTRDVAVPTDHRGSLVARGLSALQDNKKRELILDSQDERFRQAKKEFDWGPVLICSERDSPATFAAFKIFQQLANENYGRAYYPLSCLYRIGREIEDGQNRAQHFQQLAIEWCLANQANQDVELWCQLGDMYNSGDGVAQDYVQAVFWYRKAAERGHELAQLALGMTYSWGHGVQQDDQQVEYWIRKAAEHGGALAQFRLGWMYEDGDSVKQDHQQAVYWFRKAAEQGHEVAQDALEHFGIDWKNN